MVTAPRMATGPRARQPCAYRCRDDERPFESEREAHHVVEFPHLLWSPSNREERCLGMMVPFPLNLITQSCQNT